jgi:hypothetical protein
MAETKYNKPPSISTPKNAPWTDLQEVQEYLTTLNTTIKSMGSKFDDVATKLSDLIDLIQNQGGGSSGGGGGVTVNRGEVGAVQLRSNVDDAGTATGGTNNTLIDTTKYWSSNVWSTGGAIILMQIDGLFYTSVIQSNTDKQISFLALPTGVQAKANTPYAIKSISSGPLGFTLSALASVYASGAAPVAGTFYSTMVNCSALRNQVYYVVNTTDQAVVVQPIGGVDKDPSLAGLIGSSITVPAVTGRVPISLNLSGDDWYPNTGMQIIIPAGVTLGSVTVQEIHR